MSSYAGLMPKFLDYKQQLYEYM